MWFPLAAPTLCGDLSEMQNPWPPDLLNKKLCGSGPAICILTSFQGILMAMHVEELLSLMTFQVISCLQFIFRLCWPGRPLLFPGVKSMIHYPFAARPDLGSPSPF